MYRYIFQYFDMPFKRSELKQKVIKCVGKWVVAIWRFVVSNNMWIDSDQMSTSAHKQATNIALIQRQ